METIVLIRDKFENDFGFLEEGVAKEAAAEIDFAHILVEHHPRAIYTWGVKRESSAKNATWCLMLRCFSRAYETAPA